MPRHTETRQRLVEAARHLFWQHGYGAAGLTEILARAGANSGSFYHFFESKDDLLRTVLSGYQELLEPQVVSPIRGAVREPLARVFALLDGYRQRLLATGCRYGCPLGRLALEIDTENEPAHALIAANFSAWKKAVEECLREARAAQPAAAADLVLAVMEGAVMQARAYRRIEPFDAAIAQLRRHLVATIDASASATSNEKKKTAKSTRAGASKRAA